MRSVRCININNSGFSLIELIIALAILAFGLLASMQLLLVSVQGNNQTRMRDRANYEISRLIEKYKFLPFPSDATAPFDTPTDNILVDMTYDSSNNYYYKEETLNDVPITLRTTITLFEPTGSATPDDDTDDSWDVTNNPVSAELAEIVISATWTDRYGNSHKISKVFQKVKL